eukprot:536296_1
MFPWEVVYKIKRNCPITEQHILSIILYTDFDELQRECTRSFRKLSSTETDEELKDHHSEWANWAKALREAVEVWGIYFEEAPSKEKFFHGINRQMVFSGFSQRFCSPTSMSLSEDIAFGFANRNDN